MSQFLVCAIAPAFLASLFTHIFMRFLPSPHSDGVSDFFMYADICPFSDMPFLGANDVQSVAGVFFWRAVVGRDRADMSLAGRHVFKMNAAAGTSDVELAAAHCGRVIQRLVDRRLCFYVGISRDPGRRWSHHANSSAWARMIIAVETPHASASSSVEVRTLQSWGEHSLCSNRSGGGETRIAGSPHFVYVLEGSGSNKILEHVPLICRKVPEIYIC